MKGSLAKVTNYRQSWISSPDRLIPSPGFLPLFHETHCREISGLFFPVFFLSLNFPFIFWEPCARDSCPLAIILPANAATEFEDIWPCERGKELSPKGDQKNRFKVPHWGSVTSRLMPSKHYDQHGAEGKLSRGGTQYFWVIFEHKCLLELYWSRLGQERPSPSSHISWTWFAKILLLILRSDQLRVKKMR